MASTSDPEQQLQKLTAFGRGLLVRIYNVKVWRDSSDPPLEYFHDQRFTRISKVLVAKYPEIPADVTKVAGIEVFFKSASDIVNEMLPHFYAFVDLINFLPMVVKVLTSVTEQTNPIKFSLTPYLAEQFNDLYVQYIQLCLMCSNFEHKRFLTLFGVCHKLSRKVLEDNHQNVVDFFAAVEPKKIWQKIREEFKPFAKHIVIGLGEFLTTYPKIRNHSMLRSEGTFSLTLHPHRLTLPAFNPIFREIRLCSKLYNWLVYGFLSCPDAITDATLVGATTAIREGPWASIFRDEAVNICDEYVTLMKSHKSKEVKLSKYSPQIKEAKNKGLSESGASHREMRTYLRQELTSMLNVFKAQPGLLAPKLPMVLAALSATKYEILWFFRHVSQPVKSKHYKPIVLEDDKVSSLIYLSFQFSELIRDSEPFIKEYYLEFLKTTDVQRLKEYESAFRATLGTEGQVLFQDFIQTLSNLDVNPNSQVSFEDIRRKWHQENTKFALKQTPILLSKISDMIPKVNTIITHTQYVDSLLLLVSECTSLRELWYNRPHFVDMFNFIIRDHNTLTEAPTHLPAFLYLLGQFPENASGFFPVEQALIGKQVVALGEQFVAALIKWIKELIIAIASSALVFDSHETPRNAIYTMIERIDIYSDVKLTEGTQRIDPGSESEFSNRHALIKIEAYKRNLIQLLSALNEFVTYIIYDVAFSPREHLAEAIGDLLCQFFPRALFLNDKEKTLIHPPAVFVRRISIFITVLKELEYYIDLDISKVINSFMLKEIYPEDLGPPDRSLEWIKKEAAAGLKDTDANSAEAQQEDTSDAKNLIEIISNWYVRFATKSLAKASKPDVCYSVNRKSFLSRRGDSKPEAYVDLVELGRLVGLVGPYGVKIIEKKLIRWLVSSVKDIETIVKANKTDCDRLKDVYMDEEAASSLLKPFRQRAADFDKLLQKAIAIGNVLYFRRLLRESLGQVAKQKIPFIYDAVQTSFHQYPPNVFMEASLFPVDALAAEIGIDVGIEADHELRNALTPFIQRDKTIWKSLPVLFAVSFLVAPQWKECSYNPTIEAYDNNVHVLVRSIIDLIVSFSSLTMVSRDSQEISEGLLLFVKMSAIGLMRTMKKPDKHNAPKDLPSVFIFMDLFVRECHLVPRSVLDELIPYALLSSMWREVYDRHEMPR